jgi:integral membrane protein (TIGR01906 family)
VGYNQKRMKIIQYSILITLPIIIFLTTFLFIIFDYNWYNQQFIKLGIYQKFTQQEVKTKIDNLFLYFRGGSKLPDDNYTEREKLHLVDLRNILIKIKIINMILIIIFSLQLIATYLKQGVIKTIKTLFWASLFSLIVYLLFIVLLTFSFNQIFLLFHKIAFSNDYWLLDPNVESLIVLFPPSLFAQLFTRVIKISFFIASILLLFSVLFQSKRTIRSVTNNPKVF